MTGIFTRYDEGDNRKPYWLYEFDNSFRESLLKARFSLAVDSKRTICAFDAYYGPVITISQNAYGGYVSENTEVFRDDFITIDFNDISIENGSDASEALKKTQYIKNKGYSILWIDNSEQKINSLSMLIGIYDIFFPNVNPYQNITFKIQWSSQIIDLSLGLIHLYFTTDYIRLIKSNQVDFLNAFARFYRVHPLFISNDANYKFNPFVLSATLQSFLVGNEEPDKYMLYSQKEQYYSEYSKDEFNTNTTSSLDEILAYHSFDFTITSLSIPANFKKLICHKLSCYISFHKFQYDKMQYDYTESVCDDLREKDRLENLDYDPREWTRDAFDDTPGWQWNID